MSAIDDAPDYEDGSLFDVIDSAWPCCTLCNDTARWEDGTLCICMGDDPVGDYGFPIFSWDEYAEATE